MTVPAPGSPAPGSPTGGPSASGSPASGSSAVGSAAPALAARAARPAPRGFRRWRRTRPFWGGLLALLGGLELIAIPLAPMPLIVHQGMAGVASWLIGALLVAAGLLLWSSPAQRSFYGVLAVVLSLASFLTSNFGGFLVGMALGLVGGALGFAWTPGSPSVLAGDAAGGTAGGTAAPPFPAPEGPSGPRKGTARGGGRFTALALPAVLPAAFGLHLLGPSPGPSGTAPATAAPAPSATPPATVTEPARTAAPACPTPPAGGAGLTEEQARALLRKAAADPSACPAGTPATAPAAPAGRVYADPGTLRASSLTMSGLSYDGVAELPTAGGTVRALRFSMSKAVLKDVDQTAAHGPGAARLRTGDLTLTGDVVMYTTRLSSRLLGIPLTFTPERPPPLTLPSMVMTDVVSEQPSVSADGARISGLSVTA